MLDALRSFIIANASRLRYWEGGSAPLELPPFRLYPRDYLIAAERDFQQTKAASPEKQRLIHRDACIFQLKHATESAIDVFLAAYNLYDFAIAQKLKLPAKLAFIEDGGVAPTRALRRLNAIRNKIEHEHGDVQVADLELYLDIVSTFVALLQTATALATEKEATFLIVDEHARPIGGGVRFDYQRKGPSLLFSCSETDWPNDPRNSFVVGPKQAREFAFAFRIMLLLLQLEHVVSGQYVTELLGGGDAPP